MHTYTKRINLLCVTRRAVPAVQTHIALMSNNNNNNNKKGTNESL